MGIARRADICMSQTAFSNVLSSADSLNVFLSSTTWFLVNFAAPAFCQLEADWIFGSCTLLLAEINIS